MTSPRKFRIRHCNGNRAAWLLCLIDADGSECDSFGSYVTAMSIDSLLAQAGHLTPTAADNVELVYA